MCVFVAARLRDLDLDRKTELVLERQIRLDLLDGQVDLLSLRRPPVRHLEARMAAAADDPVLEEPREVSPGGALDRLLQVRGVDVGELVLLQVRRDHSVEVGLAQEVPDHVQDERALHVRRVLLVHRARLLVAQVLHRPDAARRTDVVDVVVQVRPALVRQVVLAVRLRVPQRVPERGEGLVQPDRAERPAGHHVAEPVVRELVRDDVLVREDRPRLLEGRRHVRRIAPASRSSDSVKPVALVVSIAPENSRSTTWSYLTQGYG